MTHTEIKSIRTARGETQAEFAASLECAVITVSRLERGVQEPSARILRAIERLRPEKSKEELETIYKITE